MDLDNVKLSIVGLGYVGYPLFKLFSKQFDCIGIDNNIKVIQRLQENESEQGAFCNSLYTTDYVDIANCNIHIVTVPTPIDRFYNPDIKMLKDVCVNLATSMKPGCIIIFESTVAPGTTDEICIPLLEQYSGLKINADFHVGYSPERVNVGDIHHNTANTSKIISASSDYALNVMYILYSAIIDAPIIKATSIKVAEAAKMYENVQRDVLIALANEYSNYCHSEGIDIKEVTACAATKWNFSNALPGLVGGHCIGVDPYYVIDRAQQNGLNLPLIRTAREVNEQSVIKSAYRFIHRVNNNLGNTKSLSLLVLGFSYKQDIGDIRNTKIAKFIELVTPEFSQVNCFDPLVDKQAAKQEYDIDVLTSLDELKPSYNVTIKMHNHTCFAALSVNSEQFYSLDQFL